MDERRILLLARSVIRTECRNLQKIQRTLDRSFVAAMRILVECRGKVVVTGMGKSGIIGRKIAATLASTGTPATFLHPGDAVHGDLGVVSRRDVVIAITNSGETEEILRILPSVRRIGARIISLTASPSSSAGRMSHAVIATGEIAEADPFGLIPSSSTTCALVLGDAIAFTLMTLKGFQKNDFAFLHPAGNLGRRLMLRVSDVMQTGERVPCVRAGCSLQEAVAEINRKNLGFTLVVEKSGRLKGIVTDGDLRRFIAAGGTVAGSPVEVCLTRRPLTIEEDRLAVQAIHLMEKHEITALVILDERHRPRGIVHLHDLLGRKEFGVEI